MAALAICHVLRRTTRGRLLSDTEVVPVNHRPRDAPSTAVDGRPDRELALRAARRRFLRCQRFDISALADEIGVNRVTLYRWFSSRDEYQTEAIWSLARHSLDAVDSTLKSTGPQRVIELVTGFVDVVLQNPGMQHWLAEDGEHAMRLLTRHDMPFQPRLIGHLEYVLQQEQDNGSLRLPVDMHDLAYVLVRLIESYTYLDLLIGERPESARLEPILRLLLHAPTSRRTR
jgi:AcrR family transcriptional regulator